MDVGLTKITIDKIKSIFSQHNEIDKVILYGSRAKGNFTKGSDIDLALFGSTLTLQIINKIENQIDELNLPQKVDLSIFHHLENQELIDHINRIGIEFYTK